MWKLRQALSSSSNKWLAIAEKVLSGILDKVKEFQLDHALNGEKTYC
jgi:hypothetical protein